ncbi:Co2+/Mg2+ efflux protein ApaG [Stappia sp. 28M-7]|uniref:Co2+/Mg2+ efflux protein ApaG n=1 Tax=Stappia sp. 28M-7 TaxID=2762596 RepID=UPI000E711CA5|nr:Co2+/Mg2+ efflux protein ApaG [Stappia sp. 28M-7]MBC2858377.1 Co2+/Mg2+ efflux protein ApaG [Stappia sp. 28M-7]
MYRAVTRDIQVTVEPHYLADESSPNDNRFVWAYSVDIVNLGLDTVRLRARHWRIVDALGRLEEVRGLGVVGEQPVLAPGERFEYTSGCPLRTSSGVMQGSYQMETVDGERFDVAIPAFSLDIPGTARSIN